jgi:regulator of protease activity HflC (stomatin/prohibitin superfamily)
MLNDQHCRLKTEKRIEEKVMLAKVGIGAIMATVVVGLLIMAGASPIVIVDAGHEGVVRWFGEVQPKTFGPGLHFKVPIAHTVAPIDTRLGGRDANATSASRDLQNVATKVSVQYSISGLKVAHMVNNLGDREKLAAEVIDKAIQESVKAVTASYNAEELITKRVEVKIGIQEAIDKYIDDTLSEKKLNGLVTIANMSITDFDFSGEFNASIEAKVKAEQDALRAENEKRKRITEAEADAAERRLSSEAKAYARKQEADGEAYKTEVESRARAAAIKREGDALRQSPEIVRLRLAEKWDGNLPRFTGGVIPFLNVDPEKSVEVGK